MIRFLSKPELLQSSSTHGRKFGSEGGSRKFRLLKKSRYIRREKPLRLISSTTGKNDLSYFFANPLTNLVAATLKISKRFLQYWGIMKLSTKVWCPFYFAQSKTGSGKIHENIQKATPVYFYIRLYIKHECSLS